jgi:hypothetical protein
MGAPSAMFRGRPPIGAALSTDEVAPFAIVLGPCRSPGLVPPIWGDPPGAQASYTATAVRSQLGAHHGL